MVLSKTTIQISELLRKRIKILASIRDLPYEELINDLVEFFEALIPFKNEEEFKKFFESNLEKFGFKRVLEQVDNPPYTYIVEDLSGIKRKVKLQIFAKDFTRYGYDPSKIDYIVSFFSAEDNIQGKPVVSIINPNTIKSFLETFTPANFQIIPIPKPLYKRIQEVIKDTGFSSIAEYVTFLLREIVAEKEEKEFKETLKPEEVERIRKRLKALGYL